MHWRDRLNSSVAQATMDTEALHLRPLRTPGDAVLDVLSTAFLFFAAVCALLYTLRVYFDNGGVIPLSRRCVTAPQRRGKSACAAFEGLPPTGACARRGYRRCRSALPSSLLTRRSPCAGTTLAAGCHPPARPGRGYSSGCRCVFLGPACCGNNRLLCAATGAVSPARSLDGCDPCLAVALTPLRARRRSVAHQWESSCRILHCTTSKLWHRRVPRSSAGRAQLLRGCCLSVGAAGAVHKGWIRSLRRTVGAQAQEKPWAAFGGWLLERAQGRRTHRRTAVLPRGWPRRCTRVPSRGV